MSVSERLQAWENYERELDAYESAMQAKRRRYARKHYHAAIADVKEDAANYTLEECRDITPGTLRYQFGSYVHAAWKHRGGGKEKKEYFKWQWTDYAGYKNALRELLPREYALLRCREEKSDLTSDRWWDVEGYRDEHIRDYRERIKELRLTYGLTRAEVAPYMRVS